MQAGGQGFESPCLHRIFFSERPPDHRIPASYHRLVTTLLLELPPLLASGQSAGGRLFTSVLAPFMFVSVIIWLTWWVFHRPKKK